MLLILGREDGIRLHTHNVNGIDDWLSISINIRPLVIIHIHDNFCTLGVTVHSTILGFDSVRRIHVRDVLNGLQLRHR